MNVVTHNKVDKEVCSMLLSKDHVWRRYPPVKFDRNILVFKVCKVCGW